MDKSPEYIKALENVATVAALCCIDLNANLNDANKEYMAGEIPAGAFRHVRERHYALHIALNQAGFTEKHKIFKHPVKPTVPEASSDE